MSLKFIWNNSISVVLPIILATNVNYLKIFIWSYIKWQVKLTIDLKGGHSDLHRHTKKLC